MRPREIYLKEEFINRRFDLECDSSAVRWSQNNGNLAIIKETVGRYQMRSRSDSGTRTFWCMKSDLLTYEELKQQDLLITNKKRTD